MHSVSECGRPIAKKKLFSRRVFKTSNNRQKVLPVFWDTERSCRTSFSRKVWLWMGTLNRFRKSGLLLSIEETNVKWDFYIWASLLRISLSYDVSLVLMQNSATVNHTHATTHSIKHRQDSRREERGKIYKRKEWSSTLNVFQNHSKNLTCRHLERYKKGQVQKQKQYARMIFEQPLFTLVKHGAGRGGAAAAVLSIFMM